MRVVFLALMMIFLTASSVNDARKANSAFERGDFAEAAELYRQAIDQNPDDARLYFNLARTLHELGESEAAMEVYDRFKSMTESPADQSFADYNKGRMLTDMGNYQDAIDYFREALMNNPNDTDAKFNYELAVRKQQEQENEQSPPDDTEDSEGDQDDSQSQDNQQDQDQNQDQDNQQQPGQPDQDERDSQEQQQPLEMTPEEAQNILDALEQLERELLENQKKESTNPPSRNENDW